MARDRATAVSAILGAALAMGFQSACTRERPQVHHVAIRNFVYTPDTIAVAQGDTVVWTTEDFIPHTVTARDSSWTSGSLNQGQTWRYVADTPGSYPYLCTFHPNMQGTIEVR